MYMHWKREGSLKVSGGVGLVVSPMILVSAPALLGIIWVLNWVGVGSRGLELTLSDDEDLKIFE